MDKSRKVGRRKLKLEEYIEGILKSDISVLARAITLVESNLPAHLKLSQELLNRLIHFSGKSIRIGITGAPGVGKSTFIERLGLYLCNLGYKVAVLAFDPSSTLSKGSILGDKTRMEKLSRHPNAFIRPSPSGGALGGVGRKTRETIILCESAGFNVIIVETVGVGQSEVIARSMVDFFTLLIQPGGGDELQGVKKGTVELSDVIVINKADGDNLRLAKITLDEYKRAIQYLSDATEGWKRRILLVSSLEGTGIEEYWKIVEEFKRDTVESGVFQIRRREQILDWFHSMVTENVMNLFFSNPKVKNLLSDFEHKIYTGKISPSSAVQKLFEELKNEDFNCFK